MSDRDASRLDPLPTENVSAELVPLVAQINGLLERLAVSLDGQRRFLADAAHELRSPVAALALQVQLAERAKTPEARSRAMAELAHGIERARRLVQQLLDYARLEPGVPTEPSADIDVARLAREVVGHFAPHAEERGVDLGADAAAPAHISASESEIRSLLENLVDNALRYAPAGSPVTVSVAGRGAGVEIVVADYGRGIPATERSRVFERFRRVAGDATPGTGLGLAIVKAIVDRHRGVIALEQTRPGAADPGLAVRIVFPVAQPRNAPRDRAILGPSTSPLSVPRSTEA